MKCGGCNSEVGRIRGIMVEGKYQEYCPSCSDLSEVPPKIDYASPKTKQRLQWQRDKMAKDIMQPWEVKKGETHKGYQPNKEFIKAYRGNPDKLSMYTEKELKDSGLVSKKDAKTATTKGKFKDSKRIASEFS